MQIVESRIVGRDEASASAALRSTCCNGHAAIHIECAIAEPEYSMTAPVPPPMPMRAIKRE